MEETNEKFLQKVYLSADVYAICLQHALSTEKQEIMGLLIGEVDESNVSHITACVILNRSDKQPDRVEISPEQLFKAATHAERLQHDLNKPMRVLGWYHSHPHITVCPSHVDVRTQSSYQLMDPLFVGLIFSVFSNDTGSVNSRVQLTCFQAEGQSPNLQVREVPLEITNASLELHNLKSIAHLPKIFVQEELQNIEESMNEPENLLVTLHNNSISTLGIINVLSNVAVPLCEDLEARLAATNARIKEMESLQNKLLNEIQGTS